MKVSRAIEQYLSEVRVTLEKLPIEKIAAVVDLLAQARLEGKRVFLFGNGGSAATASHFACDLSKGTISKAKPRIKAYALTDNVPLITAWANDTDYENIFAEQVENYVEPGDITIGISGSGNSPNVLRGIETAKARGARTVGFVGFDGGKLRELVDIAIVIPNDTMEQVEDVHLILVHLITTYLREVT